MKYYLIAGERSGDLHGSNLIRALLEKDPDGKFRGIGGDMMQKAGMDLMVHYSKLAFMGFWEVVKNLQTISRFLGLTKYDISFFSPDVIILVDYPGYNLKIAEFAHQKGYKVFYYISPKIWAWNTKRAFKVKKYVDRVYSILPFEKEFYQQFDVDIDFVGNPVNDAIKNYQFDSDFSQKHNIDPDNTISVLPGSRKQEIQSFAPIIKKLASAMPDIIFTVSVVDNLPVRMYSELSGQPNIKLIEGDTYDLLKNSKAAVVTSGTATLETALLNVPQVVCYRMSGITYSIAKRVIKVKYISLVNLIVDKPIVRELIQKELTVENIRIELKSIFHDTEERRQMLKEYTGLRETLGDQNASRTAAGLMLTRLNAAN